MPVALIKVFDGATTPVEQSYFEATRLQDDVVYMDRGKAYRLTTQIQARCSLPTKARSTTKFSIRALMPREYGVAPALRLDTAIISLGVVIPDSFTPQDVEHVAAMLKNLAANVSVADFVKNRVKL